MIERPTSVPYDDTLRQRLASNLENHSVQQQPPGDRRRAAVAVVVIDSDEVAHGHDPTTFDRASLLLLNQMGKPSDEPGPNVTPLTGKVDGTAGGAAVLLTRRAARLNSHANQWAFPGGRLDHGESVFDAAVREVSEEVGLRLSRRHYLGRLDDYPTRSGYVISPLVFWAGADAEPVPSPDEVASVHRISLRELGRPDSPRFVTIPESDDPVIQVRVGGDLIHAPTGAILYQFYQVAYEGETVRVNHYEQPVFAWR